MVQQQLTPSALGDEVRAWLDERWPTERGLTLWLADVVDAGYAVPTWPSAWFGRDLDADMAAVDRRRVPPGRCSGRRAGPAQPVGQHRAGVRDRGLEAALHPAVAARRGGDVPAVLGAGCGSDLAGLQTRRTRRRRVGRHGSEGVDLGAQRADYGMLVARTDWDVPKHRGISFFWCPMKQDGVEVRPIRQITGEAHFNEVFLDGARIPADHLLGGLNEGWRVLQTALAYERSVMGDMARGPRSAERRRADAEPDEATDDAEPIPDGPGAEVDLGALARTSARTATRCSARRSPGCTRCGRSTAGTPSGRRPSWNRDRPRRSCRSASWRCQGSSTTVPTSSD